MVLASTPDIEWNVVKRAATKSRVIVVRLAHFFILNIKSSTPPKTIIFPSQEEIFIKQRKWAK
jgi:hypothetical protein